MCRIDLYEAYKEAIEVYKEEIEGNLNGSIWCESKENLIEDSYEYLTMYIDEIAGMHHIEYDELAEYEGYLDNFWHIYKTMCYC